MNTAIDRCIKLNMAINDTLRKAARLDEKPWQIFNPHEARKKGRKAGLAGGGTRRVMALADRLFGRHA